MAPKRPKSSKDKKAKKGAADYSQRANRTKARALVSAAEAAWNQDLYYKSAALLEDAARRDPTNFRLIADLAMVHGKMRNYKEAEKLLERAANLAPRKSSAMRTVAQVYASIDRPELAIECYQRALVLNSEAPTTIETLVDLASLYERRHMLEEVRQLVDDALERDPTHENARLQQALLDRRNGEFDKAQDRLRALVSQGLSSSKVASSAWYELAQLLDKHGEFDEAYRAFLNAKQRLSPERHQLIQASQRAQRKSEETLNMLTPQHYADWAALANEDVPYRCALMTSHPRSGTTLAEQVLDSHQNLVSADEFDGIYQWVFQPLVQRFTPTTPVLEVIKRVPSAVRNAARRTYWERTEAIFNEPIGERTLLDKNPSLTFMLPLINWAFPEMKLLIAIRDPRDVVLSCFMQKLPLNPVSVNWLSLEGAAKYYGHMMGSWLKVRTVTRSPWLEFRYEDTVEDLESQARRLLEFLGLSWDESVLKFHERAKAKQVRSPTYEAVTKPIYRESIGRWRNYARYLEPVLNELESFVQEFGYAN